MITVTRIGSNVVGGSVAGINAVIAGKVLTGYEWKREVMGIRDGFDGRSFGSVTPRAVCSNSTRRWSSISPRAVALKLQPLTDQAIYPLRGSVG